MRILVTGGSGLIGSALIDLLLEEGHDVYLLDVNPPRKVQENVTFLKCDIRYAESVIDAVAQAKPEIIYHLATMLSIPSEANPQASFHVNCEGMFNVLEAARIMNVRQIVYASTLTTYGIDIKGDVIDEGTVQRATTLYGIAKTFGENLGRYYRKKYGIDFRCLRFASVVGPGAKVKHISIYNSWMIEKSYLGEPYAIFVTPDIRSSITYFKDAAVYLKQLSDAPAENIKTICYNTPGHKITAEELAAKVSELVPGAQLSFDPEEDVVSIYRAKGAKTYDSSKAVEEWNWSPKYSVEDMILDFGEEMKKMGLC